MDAASQLGVKVDRGNDGMIRYCCRCVMPETKPDPFIADEVTPPVDIERSEAGRPGPGQGIPSEIAEVA